MNEVKCTCAYTAWVVRICICLLVLSGRGMAAGEADYESGLNAFKSDDLIGAMHFLEQASAQGNADAQYLLGFIFDNAEENELAKSYYLQAAESGNADASYALGVMYSSGDGVERDYAQALAWYQRAVDAGHGPAAETLGMAYVRGELGLAKDPGRGRQMLQRAADAGHEPSQQLLKQAAEDEMQK